MLQRSNKQHQYLSQHQDVDFLYRNIRMQIIQSTFFQNAHKITRINIQSWILKMDQSAPSRQLKRNRNNYAKLLNLMCQCDVLLEPFCHLPPMTDLDKLSKSQINSLIDEVERFIKKEQHNKSNIQSEQPPALQNCQIVLTQHYQNNQSKKSKGSNKLVNIHQGCLVQPKTQYFSVLQQSKQSQNSLQKKEYYSQMRNRQGNRLSQIRFLNQSFNIQDNKPITQPKHLLITINTNHHNHQSVSQSDCQDIDQCLEEQKSSYFINDIRLTTEEQNYTLKTQNIDQEYTLNFSKIGEESNEQSDLESDLSERCRNRDEILNHSYFGWKMKEKEALEQNKQNFYKSKLRLTESIPSKSLIKSKINTSSSYHNQTKQVEGSQSFRSQLSLLSELQYNSSRSSQSSLKDISNSIINIQS